VGSVVTIRR